MLLSGQGMKAKNKNEIKWNTLAAKSSVKKIQDVVRSDIAIGGLRS